MSRQKGRKRYNKIVGRMMGEKEEEQAALAPGAGDITMALV